MAIHSFVEYNEAMANYVDSKVSLDPKEITVDYSNIIAISDAINKAAKDVRLKVEAVQDLHGYNNPWVGGAGKNKIPMTVEGIKAANTGGTWNGNVYTAGTLTFTLQTKDNNVVGISVNGSQTSRYFFVLGNIALGLSRGLSTWDNPTVDGYTISSGTTGDSSSTYGVGWDNSSNNVYIVMRANASVSNKVFYPQIEVGTSATAFEPYTNICPISGWSNAKVTRGGKNLLENNLASGTTQASVVATVQSDKKVVLNGLATGDAIFVLNNHCVLPKGLLKLTGNPSKGYLSALKYNSSGYMGVVYNDSGSGVIMDTSNDADDVYYVIRIVVYVLTGQLTNATYEPMISNEGGEYEPYKETVETTISLNGTRYGGTLDVTSGVLTVDRKYLSITSFDAKSGTTNNNLYLTSVISDIAKPSSHAVTVDLLSNSFEKTNYNDIYEADISGIAVTVEGKIGVGVGLNGISTREEMNTWASSNPIQVVYPLATPQTIQLTAEEVQLLLGYNTLFGDTGDISLTYNPATFGNVVEEVGEMEERVSEVEGDIAIIEGDVTTHGSQIQTLTNQVSTLNTKATNKVLYLTGVACAATTGNFVSKSDSNITANHVVVSVEYADPSAITSDVTWTTASGSLVLNGTCSTATTVNVVLVKKDN